MRSFYLYLSNKPVLWKQGKNRHKQPRLLTKPFIRLKDNQQTKLLDHQGKIAIYLPDSATSYPTIKKTLLKDQEVIHFFKQLGLTRVDLFTEIYEKILPRYQNENPVRSYRQDLEKIIQAFNSGNIQQQRQLIAKCATVPLIKVDSVRSTIIYSTPDKAYWPTPRLKNYFINQPKHYVAASLMKKPINGMEPFFNAIGVSQYPKRIPVQGTPSPAEKQAYRGTDQNIPYSQRQKLV